MNPMHVLFTTDVELWPRGWDLSSRSMARAFQRYILGNTTRGEVGLGFQLRMLADHGHRGVFFIEPLFASVMGRAPLEEIVAMIREAGQEIQLHPHTEWLGRGGDPELPGPPRMSVKELAEAEQTRVIDLARRWLVAAGTESITAFRAGAYGADRATLRALARLGVFMDSSHNPAGSRGPLDSGLSEGASLVEGVLEVPQTVYRDGTGRVRPAQLGSSSFRELRESMAHARSQGRRTYVVLSHSAELLDRKRERPDRVVLRRFERLCRHLADHRATLPTTGFAELDHTAVVVPHRLPGLTVGPLATAARYAGQLLRRVV